MQRLIDGFRRFREQVFLQRRAEFARLAEGQRPRYLLITCSDSRIAPDIVTQLDPGDLFVIRNAGNIVPDYRAGYSGEAATLEYAINALQVQVILICGHSHCGAMKGLINPETLVKFPTVRGWLVHAEKTRRRVDEKYHGCSDAELLDAAVRENVLVQLEQLRTHPSVQAAEREQRIQVHGLVYQFDTGDLLVHDEQRDVFTSIMDAAPAAAAST